MRATTVVLIGLVAGCYRPTTEQACSVTCGPGASCPAGLTCDNGVCKTGGACPVDAAELGAGGASQQGGGGGGGGAGIIALFPPTLVVGDRSPP